MSPSAASGPRTPPESASDLDREVLRRASLKVAWRISAAVAALVLILLVAATTFLMYKLAHPVLPGTIETGKPYTYLDSRDLIEGMILAGLGGVPLAGVVGWLSARSAIRPLGEALARQRRFVQDASHELRTPLAILDTRIQLAQRKTEPGSEHGQALAKIRADASTLTAIVNELLLAATATSPAQDLEPVDVTAAAKSAVDNLQDIARQQGITLIFDGGRGPALVRIDSSSFRRAMLALTDNALRHTPPEGSIIVSAAVDGPWALIRVSDTGSGIRGVDPDRIFDRFVRAARTGDAQDRRSFGIGLALVREIVSAADGTVKVVRTGPEGTTMQLRLPLARH